MIQLRGKASKNTEEGLHLLMFHEVTFWDVPNQMIYSFFSEKDYRDFKVANGFV